MHPERPSEIPKPGQQKGKALVFQGLPTRCYRWTKKTQSKIERESLDLTPHLRADVVFRPISAVFDVLVRILLFTKKIMRT